MSPAGHAPPSGPGPVGRLESGAEKRNSLPNPFLTTRSPLHCQNPAALLCSSSGASNHSHIRSLQVLPHQLLGGERLWWGSGDGLRRVSQMLPGGVSSGRELALSLPATPWPAWLELGLELRVSTICSLCHLCSNRDGSWAGWPQVQMMPSGEPRVPTRQCHTQSAPLLPLPTPPCGWL